MMVLHRCRGALPRLQEPNSARFRSWAGSYSEGLDMNANAGKQKEEEEADSMESLTMMLKATNRR